MDPDHLPLLPVEQLCAKSLIVKVKKLSNEEYRRSQTNTAAAAHDAPNERSSNSNTLRNTCANCKLKVLDGDNELLTEFASYDEGYEIQVTIRNAFATVFEHGIELETNSSLGEDSIRMCFQCTSILAELYRFYVEFMKLTRHTSYVQTIIQKSLLWHSINNFEDIKPVRDLDLNLDFSFVAFGTDGIPCKPEVGHEKRPIRNSRVKSSKLKLTPAKHSCTSCSRNFPTLLQLKYHCSSVHKLASADLVKVKVPKRILSTKTANPKTGPRVKGKIQRCRFCGLGLEFSSRSKRRRHEWKFHPSEFGREELTCPQPNCDKVFQVDKKLAWHLIVEHGIGEKDPDLVCQVVGCAKYYATPQELKQHTQTAHCEDKDKFPCAQCGTKFPSLPRLKYHVQAVHDRSLQHKCTHCGKEFVTRESWRRHLAQSHGTPKVFSCPLCNKTSTDPRFLKRHMASLHSELERNLQCDKCEKTFAFLKNLQRHLRYTHGPNGVKRLFPCTECGTTFQQPTGLRRHVLLKHSINSGPYICEICGKEFKIKEYLTQHMRSLAHGGRGTNQSKPSSGRRKREIEQPQFPTSSIVMPRTIGFRPPSIDNEQILQLQFSFL